MVFFGPRNVLSTKRAGESQHEEIVIGRLDCR